MDYLSLLQKVIKEYALTSILHLSGLKKWLAKKILKGIFVVLDAGFDNWRDSIQHKKDEATDTENEEALKESIENKLPLEERVKRESDLLNGN